MHSFQANSKLTGVNKCMHIKPFEFTSKILKNTKVVVRITKIFDFAKIKVFRLKTKLKGVLF